MFTAIVLAAIAFSALSWAIELTFKLLGWTISAVLKVLLLPLWIVVFFFEGLAVAFEVIVPIAFVLFAVSLLVPED